MRTRFFSASASARSASVRSGGGRRLRAASPARPESAASLSRETIAPSSWPRETGRRRRRRAPSSVPAKGARTFCWVSAAVSPGPGDERRASVAPRDRGHATGARQRGSGLGAGCGRARSAFAARQAAARRSGRDQRARLSWCAPPRASACAIRYARPRLGQPHGRVHRRGISVEDLEGRRRSAAVAALRFEIRVARDGSRRRRAVSIWRASVCAAPPAPAPIASRRRLRATSTSLARLSSPSSACAIRARIAPESQTGQEKVRRERNSRRRGGCRSPNVALRDPMAFKSARDEPRSCPIPRNRRRPTRSGAASALGAARSRAPRPPTGSRASAAADFRRGLPGRPARLGSGGVGRRQARRSSGAPGVPPHQRRSTRCAPRRAVSRPRTDVRPAPSRCRTSVFEQVRRDALAGRLAALQDACDSSASRSMPSRRAAASRVGLQQLGVRLANLEIEVLFRDSVAGARGVGVRLGAGDGRAARAAVVEGLPADGLQRGTRRDSSRPGRSRRAARR